jgi:hypothetical protein
MAEIVNLRDFRKKKEREAKAGQAAQNRALSGRTKVEKMLDRDAAERTKAELDAKKLEGPKKPEDPDSSGGKA